MKMQTDSIDIIMFAPCGMNCMVCYKHCYHKKPCAGCLNGDKGKPEHCRKCKIKDCIKDKELSYCFECTDYPCKMIKNLISTLIEKIENENPVIINVPNSLLYYSVMYKNVNVKSINHSLIVYGYDDETKVLYMKENSINGEVLSMLTYSQPFSSYVLTYEMFQDIYKQFKEFASFEQEKNKFFQFIYVNSKKDIKEIEKLFLQEIVSSFENKVDLLSKEILSTIEHNYYSRSYSNEQFRRTTVHSFKAIFDSLKSMLSNNLIGRFDIIMNNYTKMREKIINIMSKNAIKKSKVNVDNLNKILNDIKICNIEISNFVKENILKTEIVDDYKLKNFNNVVVEADSEFEVGSKTFSASNILTEIKVNNNFNFWMSGEENRKHWILITFPQVMEFKKIIIMHKQNIHYITKNYKVSYFNNEKNKWINIVTIKNNLNVINELLFNLPVKTSQIKIIINEPNNGIDNRARLFKIDFYN